MTEHTDPKIKNPVKTSESKLSVRIVGAGKPLILLHGWGWNSAVWEPLIPLLSPYYQLFMIDLPGYGQSKNIELKDDSFSTLAEIILAQVPTKAQWLGWSLGGIFAWWTSLYFPERITRLITVATSPRFTQAPSWPGVELATLEKFSTHLLNDHEKTLLDFLELQLRGNPHHQILYRQLKKQMFDHGQPSLPALVSGLKILQETDLRSALHKVQCPSLHIFGSHDTLVPVKVAELIPTLAPQSICKIMPRVGHMPFLFAEEFVKILM